MENETMPAGHAGLDRLIEDFNARPPQLKLRFVISCVVRASMNLVDFGHGT